MSEQKKENPLGSWVKKRADDIGNWLEDRKAKETIEEDSEADKEATYQDFITNIRNERAYLQWNFETLLVLDKGGIDYFKRMIDDGYGRLLEQILPTAYQYTNGGGVDRFIQDIQNIASGIARDEAKSLISRPYDESEPPASGVPPCIARDREVAQRCSP